MEPKLEQGYDIVLIARDWREDPGCAAVADDIARTMRRIGLMKERIPRDRDDEEGSRDGKQDPAGDNPVL